MKEAEFDPLLKIYTDRYGDFTMSAESIEMWWLKLKRFDGAHVKDAYHQLLGHHKTLFGWKDVVNLIEAMHPETVVVAKQSKDWNKNKVSELDREKRSVIDRVMGEIRNKNTRIVNTKGDRVDWLPGYVDECIKIWGVEEMNHQILKMKNQTTRRKNDVGEWATVHVPMTAIQICFVDMVYKNLSLEAI